jgi:hypothetical protein
MKIKILEMFESRFFNEYDESHDYRYALSESTDWDSVTEDEYEILKKWALEHNNDYRNKEKIVILKEHPVSIPNTIKEYLKKASEETKRKEELQNKKMARLAKKKETIIKKQEEEEKQLLKKLQEKYEN